MIVNFPRPGEGIGCRFGCGYCVWEASPDVSRFLSPSPRALERFLEEHATEVLAVNGGGDPLHDLAGRGGSELARILGTAAAMGRRTTVRTRDPAAAARTALANLVGAWKFSAPAGVSSALLAALLKFPGSEVSMVVGSRYDGGRLLSAARRYALAGSPVVIQGDYLDPLTDNAALAALAAEAGAGYTPNYFTDDGVGKAFLVGDEVRRGSSLVGKDGGR